jgi:hypothetical protein
MAIQLPYMFFKVAPGEYTPMNHGVERFKPPVQYLGKSGNIRYAAGLEAGIDQ